MQVKLRGYRIELGEIEVALLAQPGIEHAVVVAREDAAGQRLVAYVVGAGAGDADALRTGVAKLLPNYMIPAVFAELQHIPLTPNGKVDRAALPVPELEPRQMSTSERPQGELEIALAAIWREVLQMEEVGRHDNFFELGGHSLPIIKMIAGLRRVGLETDVRSVFAAPTLALLAQSLRRSRRSLFAPEAPDVPAAVDLVAVPRSALLPASFEEMHFFASDVHRRRMHVLRRAVQLTVALDDERLCEALRRTVARHEVLRTTFVQVDGAVYRQIRSPEEFRIRTEDLRGIAITEVESAVATQIAADSAMYDLANDALFKATLLRCSTSWILVLSIHHILYDAASVELLLREIFTAYQMVSDKPVSLPLQYADYAHWSRNSMGAQRVSQLREHWLAVLRDLPAPFELQHAQADLVYDAACSYVQLPFHIPQERVAALGVLAQAHGATLFMAFVAVLNLLLSRGSGRKDIVLGTTLMTRDRPETTDMMGCFVSHVVLRNRLDAAEQLSTLLPRVVRSTAEAFSYQPMPIGDIAELLDLSLHDYRQRLYSVMVVPTFESSLAVTQPEQFLERRVVDYLATNPRSSAYIEDQLAPLEPLMWNLKISVHAPDHHSPMLGRFMARSGPSTVLALEALHVQLEAVLQEIVLASRAGIAPRSHTA